MPAPSLKTITGTFTGPDGNGIACQVKAVLSQPCTVPGTQEVIQNAARVFSNPSGAFSLSLYANNDLTPTSTYYTVTAVGNVDGVPVVGTWTIVVPQTAGPFEISNLLAVPPPVPSPPGALDSQVVHLALAETITGVKHSTGGFHFDAGAVDYAVTPAFNAGFTVGTAELFAPPPSGGDDSAVIQALLTTLRIAGVGTLVLGTGTYLTSVHLIVGGGTKITGSGAALQGGTTVKVMDSSNLTAPGGIEGVFVPYEWVNNSTLCGNPFIIENVKVDANKANNGSGQVCGVIIYNFWSHVRDNYIVNTNLYGVLGTNTGRDGTTFLTNTASENRIYRNHFSATGSDAIRTIQGGAGVGANLDGFCDDNTIDSPIGSGIKFDASAGWSVRRNHGYGIKQHFIYAPKCFATVIAHNDTDDYGLEATNAQTYYGIYATSVPGAKPSRGGHIHDNALDCTEAGGSSTYHYYWVDDVGVTGTAQMTIHDNNGRYSGGGTSAGFLLTLKASAATWIYEEHNNVGLNLGTGRRVLVTSTGQVRRRPPLPSAPPATNQYLTTPFNNVTTIQITNLNSMYLVPVDVSVEQTFTGIWLSLSVVGTGAGSVARLGIYGDDGTFAAPAGSVIEDVGTVDMLATTGDKGATFASPRKLLPARYWLAVVVQVALTVGPTLNSANGGQAIALPQANVGAAQGRVWTMTGVTGALPALSGLTSASISPLLALKAQ